MSNLQFSARIANYNATKRRLTNREWSDEMGLGSSLESVLNQWGKWVQQHDPYFLEE